MRFDRTVAGAGGGIWRRPRPRERGSVGSQGGEGGPARMGPLLAAHLRARSAVEVAAERADGL